MNGTINIRKRFTIFLRFFGGVSFESWLVFCSISVLYFTRLKCYMEKGNIVLFCLRSTDEHIRLPALCYEQCVIWMITNAQGVYQPKEPSS